MGQGRAREVGSIFQGIQRPEHPEARASRGQSIQKTVAVAQLPLHSYRCALTIAQLPSLKHCALTVARLLSHVFTIVKEDTVKVVTLGGAPCISPGLTVTLG